MNAKAELKYKRVIRDGDGKRDHLTVTHAIKNRRGEYHYDVEYAPEATDADVIRHMRLLKILADEQADKQDELDPLLGQIVTSSGLTGYVGSIAAHIEKPEESQLLLNFWVEARNTWVKHRWYAIRPGYLPSAAQVQAFITSHLDEMATD